MSNYRAGDIIRMTREFVGMSREELSDEICSVQTLYRIESGKTRVKRELYARLMAKMERIAMCSDGEVDVWRRALYGAQYG